MPSNVKKIQVDPEDDSEPRSALLLDIKNDLKKIRDTYRGLDDISDSMPGTETLRGFADFFRDIGSTYKSYIEIRSNPYFEFLRRSQQRQNDAKAVVKAAIAVAGKFDDYVARRVPYRRTQAQSTIDSLINALTNLQDTCK